MQLVIQHVEPIYQKSTHLGRPHCRQSKPQRGFFIFLFRLEIRFRYYSEPHFNTVR